MSDQEDRKQTLLKLATEWDREATAQRQAYKIKDATYTTLNLAGFVLGIAGVAAFVSETEWIPWVLKALLVAAPSTVPPLMKLLDFNNQALYHRLYESQLRTLVDRTRIPDVSIEALISERSDIRRSMEAVWQQQRRTVPENKTEAAK